MSEFPNFSYVTNRDRCGLPDEETRLEQLRDDFCLKQQRQFGIEQQLEKVSCGTISDIFSLATLIKFLEI